MLWRGSISARTAGRRLAVLTSPGTPNERCSSSVQYEPANLAARLWKGGRGFEGPGLQRDPPHSPTHTIYGEEKNTLT